MYVYIQTLIYIYIYVQRERKLVRERKRDYVLWVTIEGNNVFITIFILNFAYLVRLVITVVITVYSDIHPYQSN